MQKLLLATALVLVATPAFAKEYTIKEITTEDGKPVFSPNKLTIQPGDTVTFENAEDAQHEVMFISQPKQVDEMIMSPMHDKKGDKFTYTFTVPGTYQFHCHPHEAAGMKGTLIVDVASKVGETKTMDHHKLAKKLEGSSSPSAGGDTAEGVGKVIAVDAQKHTIKVKHEPIKALGWPVMTMLLNVDPGVDLSGIQAGDAVSFTLKPQGKDDYIISKITKN